MGTIKLGQHGGTIFIVVQHLTIDAHLVGCNINFMSRHASPPFAKSKAALQPPKPESNLMKARFSVGWF